MTKRFLIEWKSPKKNMGRGYFSCVAESEADARRQFWAQWPDHKPIPSIEVKEYHAGVAQWSKAAVS